MAKGSSQIPEAMEIKVVLLGLPSVGKTSLFRRFVNDAFSSAEPVTLPGADCCGRGRVACRGAGGPAAEVTIVLWDTAGAEVFRSFSSIYYKGSSAAILCYDLGDYTTLLRSAFWVSDLAKALPDAALFLCGCKSDLLPPLAEGGADRRGRQLDDETLREFAERHSIPKGRVFSVSAKTGRNVTQLFEAVAASCCSRPQRQPPATAGTEAAPAAGTPPKQRSHGAAAAGGVSAQQEKVQCSCFCM